MTIKDNYISPAICCSNIWTSNEVICASGDNTGALVDDLTTSDDNWNLF